MEVVEGAGEEGCCCFGAWGEGLVGGRREGRGRGRKRTRYDDDVERGLDLRDSHAFLVVGSVSDQLSLSSSEPVRASREHT